MPSSESALKRSSSALSDHPHGPLKHPKRYHHHHHLRNPLNAPLAEPAVTDDLSLDQWMDRAVATSLRDTGYDDAQPVAMECVRQAAEECTCISHYARSTAD